MNKLCETLLSLLSEIDSICKENSITYYAAGGTTIGAVRHNGFIPWDDDVDIYMTRENFRRFREVFHQIKPPNRALECLEDNPEYTTTIPRYIDTTTTFLTRTNCLGEFAGGQIIDIFILDPIPDDEQLALRHRAILSVYCDIITPYFIYSHRNRTEYYDLYYEYIDKMKTIGKEKTLALLEKELFKFNIEDCSRYMLTWGTLSHIFPKDMFLEPVYFKFENLSIPLPTKWYDYLTMLYGVTWFELPNKPSEEHHIAVSDLDNSYELYTNEYIDKIDKEVARSQFYERKWYFIERERLGREIREIKLENYKNYIIYAQMRCIDDNHLRNLCKNRKWKDIIDLFKQYLNVQLDVSFIGKMRHNFMYRYYNPIFINLGEDYTCIIITALCCLNKLKSAKIILSLLEASSKVHSEIFYKTKNLLQKLFLIYETFYNTEYAKANNLAKEIMELNLDIEFVTDYYFYTLVFLEDDHNELYNLKDKISALHNFNNVDVLKMANANILWKLQDFENAKLMYNEILKTTRNGIFLLDIQNKLNISVDINDVEPPSSNFSSNVHDLQFKLLSELASICRKNNITYYLHGRTCWSAVNKNDISNEIFNSIMMTAENAIKLKKILENNMQENRFFKTPMNSEEMNHHRFYYGDTDSLFYNFNNYESMQDIGIYIIIYIFESQSRFKLVNKVIDNIDKSLRLNTVNIFQLDSKKKLHFKKFLNTFFKVFSILKFKRIVFNFKVKLSEKSKSKNYFISYNKGLILKKKKIIDREILSDIKYVNIKGVEFAIPIDDENYLKNFKLDFDSDQKTNSIKFSAINTDISQSDFKKNVSIIKPSDKVIKDYYDSLKINKHYNKITKKTSKYWAIVCSVRDKKVLSEFLLPKLEIILNLLEIRDLENLDIIFQEYNDLSEYYYGKQMALNFDNDIFKCYIRYLRLKKRTVYANNLLKYSKKGV